MNENNQIFAYSRNCKYSRQDLVQIVENLDANYEIKVLASRFLAFLKHNLCDIVDLILNNNEVSEKFVKKSMVILLADYTEIRRVFNNDDGFFSLLLGFLEKSRKFYRMESISRFLRLLEQIILRSEFDFLGKIPNPVSFLGALLELSFLHPVFCFLLDFFGEKNVITEPFFIQGRLVNQLFLLLDAEAENSCYFMHFIDKIVETHDKRGPLVESILTPQYISDIISFSIETHFSISGNAAIEFLMKIFEVNTFEKAIRDQISKSYDIFTLYIIENHCKFDGRLENMICLIINILQYHEESHDEEETVREIPESIKYETVPKKDIFQTFSSTPQLSRRLFDTEPSFKYPMSPLSPVKAHPISRLPPLPRVPNPLPPPKPGISTSNAALAVRNSTPSFASSFSPTREASANFSLMSLVHSCPLFPIQGNKMFAIEEIPEECDEEPIFEEEEIEEDISDSFNFDVLITMSVSLINLVFDTHFFSKAHLTILKLLQSIDKYTTLLPQIVQDSNLILKIVNYHKFNHNHINGGFIHEIERLLIQNMESFSNLLDDRLLTLWKTTENSYTQIGNGIPKKKHIVTTIPLPDLPNLG